LETLFNETLSTSALILFINCMDNGAAKRSQHYTHAQAGNGHSASVGLFNGY